MRRVGFWSLYTSIYTGILGAACLLFTDFVPAIQYAPGDKVWVKITGMCLMAISYFNWTIFKERPKHILQASLVNQAFCAIFMGVVAWLSGREEVYWIEGIIVVGLIGATFAYYNERAQLGFGSGDRMPRTAKWNIYVAGYTFTYGTASAVVPKQLLPLVGFSVPEDLWVRVAGMCFYYLFVFNVVTYLHRGKRPIIFSILLLRIWFVLSLVILGIFGYPWFVYLSAAIVAVGVFGTIFTYRSETRAMKESASNVTG